MKRCIVIRTTFAAIHCWPECDIPTVEYLQNPHRHVFHVTVKWVVQHDDRDLEFIHTKMKVDKFLKRYNNCDIGRVSCEDICKKIHDQFPLSCFVSVFEDNENGVEVTYD